MGALIDNYSKEELEGIVANSTCLSDVVRKIGYSCVKGSNNNTVTKRLQLYNISTGHFQHKKPVARTYENVFCTNSSASQATLRRWFVKRSNNNVCAICGHGVVWNGKSLTMILDHINGDKHDNRIENLRWICPNCDSQLDTFAGRNLKKK